MGKSKRISIQLSLQLIWTLTFLRYPDLNLSHSCFSDLSRFYLHGSGLRNEVLYLTLNLH